MISEMSTLYLYLNNNIDVLKNKLGKYPEENSKHLFEISNIL